MTEADYIRQLNPMEQKVLHIARTHLETSFSLEKSIGFQEWQQRERAQATAATQATVAQALPAAQATAAQALAAQTTAEPTLAQAIAVAAPPVVIKRKPKIKIAARTKILSV